MCATRTKHKHENALKNVKQNLPSFLITYMDREIGNVINKELCNLKFFRFLLIVFVNSSEILHGLKSRLSTPFSSSEKEFLEKVICQKKSMNVEPDVTKAAELFMTDFPCWLKHVMQTSGFDISEIQECHESYVTFYSSVIILLNENLINIKSKISATRMSDISNDVNISLNFKSCNDNQPITSLSTSVTDKRLNHEHALSIAKEKLPSLLISYIDREVGNGLKEEHHKSKFFRFLLIIFASSLEILHELKSNSIAPFSSTEKGFLEKVIVQKRSINVEPEVQKAADSFMTNFPCWLKQIMRSSGFDHSETQESHASFVTLYSSVIILLNKNLIHFRCKMFTSPGVSNDVNDQIARHREESIHNSTMVIAANNSNTKEKKDGDTSINQSSKLVVTTEKHHIYYNSRKNIALKVLISTCPSNEDIENLDNEVSEIK